MATKTGSGYSDLSDSKDAGLAAAKAAVDGIGGGKADLAVVFCSPTYDFDQLLAGVREAVGTDSIVGCTTAGEFNESRAGKNSVSVMAIASDDFHKVIRAAIGLKNNYENSIRGALGNFKENQRKMLAQGYGHTTVMVLSDGLAGNGEGMVDIIQEMTGMSTQIVGGAAGDNGAFQQTSIFAGTKSYTDSIVLVQFFSKKPFGIGVRHGLSPQTDRMRVTKSVGNVVHEIDGKPAYDVYREFASGRGVTLTAENAGTYMIENELGIQSMANISKIRAPLGPNEDGSINMATEVPENSMVCIMDGEPDAMLASAREAAEEAKKNLQGNAAAGVILFDCICRGLMLKDRFSEEISTIGGVLGGVPVAGFETYGEIARFSGQLTGFHNSTAVVCAFPA